MKLFNKKGAITVFMVIILPAVMIAGLVLSDAAVLKSGRVMSCNAVDSAALIILGNYSSWLKETYGIYGCCLDEETSGKLAQEAVLQGLPEKGLYDFRIESIEVNFSGALSDPCSMEEAVMAVAGDDLYMNAADEFIERLDILESIKGTADIIKLKMEVDEAVMKFREAGELLNDLVNGGDGTEFFINNAILTEDLSNALSRIHSIYIDMLELGKEIDELGKLVSEIETEKAAKLNLLEEAMGVLREKAAEIYTEEIEKILSGLTEANNMAMENIKTMIEEKININFLSGLVEDSIKKAESLPSYAKDILLSLSEIVKDIEDEAADLVFERISESINENIILLGRAVLFSESIVEYGETNEVDLTKPSDFINTYNCSLSFSFNKSGKAGKDKDQRGFFEELGKRVLEKRTGKDIEITKEEILPTALIKSSPDECSFEVNASGKSTAGAERQIDEFSNGELTLLEKTYNTLCIDEYLLNHLGSETKSVDGSCFFDNEIEYVLWGNRSQNINRFYTKSALMGTRFALNAVHVYSDTAKKAKADAVAATTAGWWTMGAGIPVMSNLVRCAWAIAESGYDVSRLCEGDSVAIVKRKADWVTDIGTAALGVKSPELLCMDYEDYLRLFLLIEKNERKMACLADLIQLNSRDGFDIFSTFTCVRINAVISFRSITGGRHEETIEISRGYTGDGIG